MTENTTTTTTRRFNHTAIAKDLTEGKSVTDVAATHGCSVSLIHEVRRKMANGGKRLAKNEARASALRTKATQFKTDLDLLAKWAKNDAAAVSELISTIEDVVEGLTTAAELYDSLPPAVMLTKRASQRVPLEPGMVVRVAAKARKKWDGVLSNHDHLTVELIRDTHVFVRDDNGAPAFVPRKELEVRQDG
jgi:transposase-like protein